MKIMKKLDVVIIIVLLVISFVPYIMLTKYQKSYKGKVYAVISIDGKEKERVSLNEEQDQEFTFESNYGFNKVVVHDGSVGVVDADCTDQICKSAGFIDKVGEKIVCLPNKLIVEIVGDANNNSEEDVISR
ncbi:NusG domain II-containing protein [Clostridium sp.]|uniref:NusG domain II-containing protein n=1 Tax=Clostridium sp. TaxID=1506 RepID=UPI0032170A9A